MAARTRIPAAQQIDVHYDEMESDWRGTMRRLYAFADLAFDAATEQRMAGWLVDAAREAPHTGHRYRLEDFGLSAEAVEARMGFVRERAERRAAPQPARVPSGDRTTYSSAEGQT